MASQESAAMEKLLTPVEPVRTFEVVAAQLRNAITSGRLKPGAQLPGQRELAEQFGVSRSSLAQAIRILERIGLVTVKRGAHGGAFVRHIDARQLIDSITLLLDLDRMSVEELVELRIVIEGQNAAWAAQRATDRDLADLGRIVRRSLDLCQAAVDGGPESDVWSLMLAEDAQFHDAVARAAHNRASRAVIVGALGSLNRQLQKLSTSCAPAILASQDEILESIRKGQPELARRHMQTHINLFALEIAEQGLREARS